MDGQQADIDEIESITFDRVALAIHGSISVPNPPATIEIFDLEDDLLLIDVLPRALKRIGLELLAADIHGAIRDEVADALQPEVERIEALRKEHRIDVEY